MLRRSPVIWTVLALAAGTGLFLVKHRVHDLEARLAQINRAIVEDQEAIHVLRAEWGHLNRPARLEVLSRRFLAFEPLRRERTITINQLSQRLEPGRTDRDATSPAADPQGEMDAWLSRLMAGLRTPQ